MDHWRFQRQAVEITRGFIPIPSLLLQKLCGSIQSILVRLTRGPHLDNILAHPATNSASQMERVTTAGSIGAGGKDRYC